MPFDSAPNTPADLQRVTLRRVSDMQHALHHDDFAQGREFKKLRPESAVQIWVAERLRLKQGRARNTDANLPLEIKVAESWTLLQLEDALVKQLGGRYLRAQDARHGVLLVAHQDARRRGWRNAQRRMLTFAQVIAHLQRIADATTAIAPDEPQARIAVLDVSDIQTRSGVKNSTPKRTDGPNGKPKWAPKPKAKKIKKPIWRRSASLRSITDRRCCLGNCIPWVADERATLSGRR